MTTPAGAVPRNESLTRAAVGLAAAAVLVWVILAAIDHDGPAWVLMPLFGIGAAVAAYRAGGTSPKNMPAFVAFIIGVAAVIVFLAWLIVGD